MENQLTKRQRLLLQRPADHNVLSKPHLLTPESQIDQIPSEVIQSQVLSEVPELIPADAVFSQLQNNEAPLQDEEFSSKPKCKLCGKIFSFKYNLTKHLKQVHSDKPKKYLKHKKIDDKVVCKICYQPFKHSQNLKTHYATKHKVEELEEEKVPLKSVINYARRKPISFSSLPSLRQQQELQKAKRFQLLNNRTREKIIELEYLIPFLKMLAYEEAPQSNLELEIGGCRNIYMDDEVIHKIYKYEDMLEDQTLQINVQNEYAILTQASINKSKYLASLIQASLGFDHLSFTIKKYEMTFRDFLEERRDHRKLIEIFTAIGSAILELHALGYVHRDLKPDNVMLSFKPMQVILIDFERATPRTCLTKGSPKGTPGYMPNAIHLRDGSTRWDVWAFAAMLLEADMEPRVYKRMNDERQSVKACDEHIRSLGTCNNLKIILRETMACGDIERMKGLEWILKSLKDVRFNIHKNGFIH